ncbi:hypothetical protein [Kocuria sp.]|uniref:hypothetical protein n=1 Tax=Kocuria sp. TaxID=1871328 RepID=UPI0026DAFE07|nr:hypothetical protein [Kocuria sp.]MDO4920048.1 hypothetical protein [Kocuria sp.]
MNRRVRALPLSLALAALALTGCGGGDDAPTDAAGSSASATTSATTSPTRAASSTPAAEPPSESAAATAPVETAEPVETTGPEPDQTPVAEAAGEADVQEFFRTGGQCIADVWSSSLPATDELHQQVIDYCAAHQLGDWSHGYDPMDPENMGGGTAEPRRAGEETPAADENGYVGPSDEYYDYSGYVAPGFEYQVGSECFDPTLGRCKSSGEIQSENLGR